MNTKNTPPETGGAACTDAPEQKKCKDKVAGAWESRKEDLEKLWAAYTGDPIKEECEWCQGNGEFEVCGEMLTALTLLRAVADNPCVPRLLSPSQRTTIRSAVEIGEKYREDDIECRFCDGEGEIEDEEFDQESIYDYGLAFDYVAPGTFNDQNEGYWRYQISCGGPSEELRFYSSSHQSQPYKIEFWYLDWFDGASVDITREEIALTFWQWFSEVGSTEAEQDKALEE